MSDAMAARGLQLDDRDPRLFQYPQERRLLLRRPDGGDLILVVSLAYVDDAMRAVVTSARQAYSGASDEWQVTSGHQRSAIEQLVRDFFHAEPPERA